MGIKSSNEIYGALEERLRGSAKPLTCVDLMDMTDIRSVAIAKFGKDVRIATNKVSDALGLMWRRNLLIRYPADGGTLARYAYAWRDDMPHMKAPCPPSLLTTTKTGVVITEEDGGVRIEFDKFTVFIQPK